MTKIVETKKYQIILSEQTVRELLCEIEKNKKMEENIESISVESAYSSVSFKINLETKPYTQESMGYYTRERFRNEEYKISGHLLGDDIGRDK